MKHSTQSTKYQGSGPTSPKHYELFDGLKETLDLIEDRLSPEAYAGYLEWLISHTQQQGEQYDR